MRGVYPALELELDEELDEELVELLVDPNWLLPERIMFTLPELEELVLG